MCAQHQKSCHSSHSCHCNETGPHIRGFLIPCLLVLLNKNSSHGYQLIELLEQSSYMPSLPDAGVIYRHLRALEQDGMIESSLEEGGGGPARKVYSITAPGRECLRSWSAGLKNVKQSIDRLIADIEAGTNGEAV